LCGDDAEYKREKEEADGKFLFSLSVLADCKAPSKGSGLSSHWTAMTCPLLSMIHDGYIFDIGIGIIAWQGPKARANVAECLG